jgi:hypothetical protein
MSIVFGVSIVFCVRVRGVRCMMFMMIMGGVFVCAAHVQFLL